MRQVIVLALLGLAAVSATTPALEAKQVENRNLGAVIFSEDIENRTVVGVVRINKELLRELNNMARGGSNRYKAAEDTERYKAFSQLVELVEHGCARLGNNRTLSGKEIEIPITKHVEQFVINQQGEPGVKLHKALDLYRTAFEELLQRPTSFGDLKSQALMKSLRKIAQSEKSGVQILERVSRLSDVGCADSDTLLINVTFAYAKEEHKHKLSEVMDYGRFHKDGEFFVRAQVAKHWLRRKDRWERLSFDECTHVLDNGLWACPRSSAIRTNLCNPDDVFRGCRPSVWCVANDSFVLVSSTGDDKIVLATVQKTYRLMTANGKWDDLPMPESGVVILNLPVGEQIVVGGERQTIIQGISRTGLFAAIAVKPANLPINESLLTCDEQPNLVFVRDADGPAMLVSAGENDRVAELEKLANETRWGLVIIMVLLVITLIAVVIAGYLFRQPIIVHTTNLIGAIKKQPSTETNATKPRSPRTSIYKAKLPPILTLWKNRNATGTELAVHAEEGLAGVAAAEASKPLMESTIDEPTQKQ